MLPPSLAPSFGCQHASEQRAGAGGAALRALSPPHDAKSGPSRPLLGPEQTRACHVEGVGQGSLRRNLESHLQPSSLVARFKDMQAKQRALDGSWGTKFCLREEDATQQSRRVSWRPIAAPSFRVQGPAPVSARRGAPLTPCPSQPLVPTFQQGVRVFSCCAPPLSDKRRPNFFAQPSARARPTLLPPLSSPGLEAQHALRQPPVPVQLPSSTRHASARFKTE